MPKVLTEAQVQAFERDGCLSPVRAMSAERARHYRERFEALEARVPDIKKMKTKSHLLCPVGARDRRGPAHPRHLRGPDRAEPPLLEHGLAGEEGRRRDLRGLAPGLRLRGGDPGGARRAGPVGVRRVAGLPPRHPGLAQVGHPEARRERRSPQHPRQGAVHHRRVRRDQGGGLRAPARRDGDVRQHAWSTAPARTWAPTGASCCWWRCCRPGPSRPGSARPPCSCAGWTPPATSTTSRVPTPSGRRPRSPTGPRWSNARAKLIFEDSKVGPSEAYGGTRAERRSGERSGSGLAQYDISTGCGVAARGECRISRPDPITARARRRR